MLKVHFRILNIYEEKYSLIKVFELSVLLSPEEIYTIISGQNRTEQNRTELAIT